MDDTGTDVVFTNGGLTMVLLEIGSAVVFPYGGVTIVLFGAAVPFRGLSVKLGGIDVVVVVPLERSDVIFMALGVDVVSTHVVVVF